MKESARRAPEDRIDWRARSGYNFIVAITKIVSGGQTGADRGGLEAAMCCGLPHGGWCPKGRRAEDGRIPEKYQLQETDSAKPAARTKANVVDSDATLVFTFGPAESGSLFTIQCCTRSRKPWHHVNLANLSRDRAVREILDWLHGAPLLNDYRGYKAIAPDPCVLNVAGSRESRCPGIGKAVMRIVVDVLAGQSQGET